ncbi:MAG: cadmium-translocating P-type ATPase [Opitutaceae bacterium]|jgi:Cd2+/Zn2+-exporting ATPase|nr:cadmium-translocating P-type ATPase [Opitutaceae bacterium]
MTADNSDRKNHPHSQDRCQCAGRPHKEKHAGGLSASSPSGHDHPHDHAHGECCDHHHGHGHEYDHDKACNHGHTHDVGCDHEAGGAWRTPGLIASGLCVTAALALEWGHIGPAGAVTVVGAAGIVTGGWCLLPGAWQALRRLRPTIPLLVVLATVGAAIIGQWSEAATVVFLFGVAEWLEGWADRRSQRAARALLEIAPDSARIRTPDNRAEEVPTADVPIDAIVLVRGGERIPLDGVVTAGRSSVNQAPVTGESIPVDKQPGDTVFAGAINSEGLLEVRVTKVVGDTILARIIRLVQEAQAQRAPTQRFVDVFARHYTPWVTLLALLVFLVPPLLAGGAWTVWLYRACVLLLIACPCALVISTPVGIVAGLTSLARRGVLVKGGAHLETIGRLRALAFDKTGTLTEGKPRVLDIVALPGANPPEVLRLAAAIDEHSTHPLAQAIVERARADGITWPQAEACRAQPGRGAEAIVADRPAFVGNHRLAHELGVCTPELEARLEEIENRGQSVVVVGERPANGTTGRVLGVLALGDALRTEAKPAVAALHAAGVRHLVMLSGDNQRTVDAIAREAGIDEARGGLLPEDKVAGITALRERHGIAGMVGDGINDAPAMAAASVSIAMGAAGTDAAIETADIALMKDDLGKIADAVRTGRRTLAIIRFNITFALGLKALFLAMTLFGIASLWLAILADTGATLLVVANSLRLLARGKT